MAARTFNCGDEVFSLHGEAGRYVARATNGHLVEPIFDSQDEEPPHYDTPVLWREVFEQPPVQRLHADIAKQEERLSTLQAEISRLADKRREFEQQERATRDRLTRHQQLAYIDDVLEGRITHVLVKRRYYGPYVLRSFAEFVKFNAGDGDRKMIPLLVLAATPATYREKSEHWWNKLFGMHWFTTEGGEFEDCWLFPSLQAAMEAAAKMLEAEIADARKEAEPRKVVPIEKIASLVANMKALGLGVPDDLLATWTLQQQRAAESKVAARRKESEKAQKELEEAEAAARAAGVAL